VPHLNDVQNKRFYYRWLSSNIWHYLIERNGMYRMDKRKYITGEGRERKGKG